MTAASRHEHLALYDPAAIPADTPVDPDLEAEDPKLPAADAIRNLAGRGQALILHIPTEDCEARLHLFVNEAPPETIRTRGTAVLAGATLRVPSGLLRADGLEFMARPGEVRTHAVAEETRVPPAQYSVDVFELISWKLRHRKVEGRAGVGRLDTTVHRLITAYTWLGIILLPANLFIAPMVLAYFWRTGGMRGALTAAAAVLAIDAVIVAGFWILQAAQKRFPILLRTADADTAFERDNPDIAIVLRSESAASAGVPAFTTVRIAVK